MPRRPQSWWHSLSGEGTAQPRVSGEGSGCPSWAAGEPASGGRALSCQWRQVISGVPVSLGRGLTGRGLIRLAWRQLILGAACARIFREAGQVTEGHISEADKSPGLVTDWPGGSRGTGVKDHR